ncbi:hypothetical protein THOM_1717 [Trachipleistophora hominis]|uniref:Uncharacterized protein n=1 Tax=Trachipleistophora hominis TaxID=72359 RepID=L7JWA4_TRAHO|nr:hypothetical protein THOM_1717 [Trachipleistophora hominis]
MYESTNKSLVALCDILRFTSMVHQTKLRFWPCRTCLLGELCRTSMNRKPVAMVEALAGQEKGFIIFAVNNEQVGKICCY